MVFPRLAHQDTETPLCHGAFLIVTLPVIGGIRWQRKENSRFIPHSLRHKKCAEARPARSSIGQDAPAWLWYMLQKRIDLICLIKGQNPMLSSPFSQIFHGFAGLFAFFRTSLKSGHRNLLHMDTIKHYKFIREPGFFQELSWKFLFWLILQSTAAYSLIIVAILTS